MTMCGQNFVDTPDVSTIKLGDISAINVSRLDSDDEFYDDETGYPNLASDGCYRAETAGLPFADYSTLSYDALPYPMEIALNGQQYTNGHLTYYYYEHPTLSSVTPLIGSIGGTLAITITGIGFINVSALSLIRVRSVFTDRNGTVLTHEINLCVLR